MAGVSETDPWLGVVYQFPTVLHARASLSFDMSSESLQKVLIRALSSLREKPMASEITVSSSEGYSKGKVGFKIGIGNGEGFDILDANEVERVFKRIENHGAFEIIDTAVHLHYSIQDQRRHRIHEDHYIARLVFGPGRIEVLIHHMKGIKRVDPPELVGMLLDYLNVELASRDLPMVVMESISST